MLLRAGLVFAVLALAIPAQAASVRLAVDPLQSSLTPDGGSPDPLNGRVDFDLGELPVGSPTPLDLRELNLLSDSGISVRLDDALANPGAGVLRPDGTFEIPTLFVTVDDSGVIFDLGIPDVTGTVLFGPGGLRISEFSTSLIIDAGPQGLINATLLAIPEPSTGALLVLGLGALASTRRSRRSDR